MAIINTAVLANCSESLVAALGRENCGAFKGLPKGFVFTLPDFSFDISEYNSQRDIVTLLNSNVHFGDLSVVNPRMPNYPQLLPYYPNMVNFEPNGGDPNIITEGFSSGKPNGINAYSETYTIVDGGKCLYDQLIKLEGRQLRVFKIDENDVLYGTINKKTNHVRGMMCYVSVTPRENTGTQTAAITLLLTYDIAYKRERDNEVAIPLGEELCTMRAIAVQAGMFAQPSNFRIVSACSGKSITEHNSSLAQVFVSNPNLLCTAGGGRLPSHLTITYNKATDLFWLDNTADPTILAIDLRLNDDLYNIPQENGTYTVNRDLQFFLGEPPVAL